MKYYEYVVYIHDCGIIYIYIIYTISIKYSYIIYTYNNIHTQLHYLHWDPHWLVSNQRINPSPIIPGTPTVYPIFPSIPYMPWEMPYFPSYPQLYIYISWSPAKSPWLVVEVPYFACLSPSSVDMCPMKFRCFWPLLPSEVWTKVHWIFPVTIPRLSDGTLSFCPQQIATWGFNQKMVEK